MPLGETRGYTATPFGNSAYAAPPYTGAMSPPALLRALLSGLILIGSAGCAPGARSQVATAPLMPLLLQTTAQRSAAQVSADLRSAVAQANAALDPAGQADALQLRPVSPGWFAFSLSCESAATCAAVRQQLAQQTDWITALIDDGRRSVPRPVGPGRAR